METQLPLPKVAHICCGRMAAGIEMPLGMEVGLGPGDFVLDGDPAPRPQKGGGAPKFSANVYCGQTARWIKIVVGIGDFMLDGDPVPLPKRWRNPLHNFRPISIVANLLDASRCHLV